MSNHEAERTTGIWAPLSNARLFSLRRRLVDGRNATRYLVENHIRPEAGEAMLDLGCGLCGILEHLPPLRYVGIDWQSNYLNRAKALYGDRGTFLCRDITKLGDEFAGQFDIVVARGLLHHLDDDGVAMLAKRVKVMLHSRGGGRFVTLDPVRLKGQTPIPRMLIALDRGRHIRGAEDYRRLLSRSFDVVDWRVMGDLLRVPYDHLIMTCRK